MKLTNDHGESVYYNCVKKHDQVRYIVKAIDGQTIRGRDRQKRKSRSFSQEHQAEKWLQANGYK